MKYKLNEIAPTKIQISHSDYLENPEIFFHFNYFGRQLFIVNSRGRYVLKSQNWIPDTYSNSEDFWRLQSEYIWLMDSKDLGEVLIAFMDCVYKLFNSSNCGQIPQEIVRLYSVLGHCDKKLEELPF